MYDTIYANHTNEQMSCLFHSSNWSRLSADEKLAACQEMHNRYADEHGMQRCQLEPKDMNGAEYGAFNPSTSRIELNRSILETGNIVTENGQLIPVPGSNDENLNTVYHESSHAYDMQLKEAAEARIAAESENQNGEASTTEASYNEAILRDAQARNIDVDLARASDSIYISPSSNTLVNNAYVVQDCERRANATGETETDKVFSTANARLGTDAQYTAYRENQAMRSNYDNALSSLKEVTKDENFDKTLNEQTTRLYYNDQEKPVHGTPESRAFAASLVKSTPGGQRAALLNDLGYQNEHLNAASTNTAETSASNAASAASVNASAASGNASAASGATGSLSTSDNAATGATPAADAGSTAGSTADADSAGSSGSADDAGSSSDGDSNANE